MNDLIVYLNVLSIYGRLCHNLTTGSNFFQDHEFFGEIYGYSESAYDSVVERSIGLNLTINIQEINLKAASICAKINLGTNNNDKLKGILEIFNTINSTIDKLVKSKTYSIGTEQLIGDIANQIEMFQYKLKQRLKD